MDGLGEGAGRVAVDADRLRRDGDVVAVDRRRQPLVDRTSYFRRRSIRRDGRVLAADDLPAIVAVVEIGMEFAGEGDAAAREDPRHIVQSE